MTILEQLEAAQKTDLLEVKWLDIVAWSGWTKSTDDTQAPSVCLSYGFPLEVKETEGRKSIALSATVSGSNGNSEFNQSITIPVDCVLEVKKVQ